MAFVEAFLEIFGRPTVGAIVLEMMIFLGPVWIAFFLGIMVGWAWKPRWASFDICKFDGSAPSSPPALIPSPVKMGFGSTQNFDSIKVRTPNPSFASSIVDTGVDDTAQLALQLNENPNCSSVRALFIKTMHLIAIKKLMNMIVEYNSHWVLLSFFLLSSSSHLQKDECRVVKEEDFEHLCHLVERKDGGPPWKHVMDRSSPMMSYQAWQRDPETGPPQYCSRTVYEDATPELLRDFFWDDEFRLEWDDMLLHAVTIEECPTTGTMVVHWIRKFPFFCSDREYTIGRRIWESGRTYYCVTKGVHCPSVPRRQKPRRVDLYYSSWSIQAVGSRKGNGHLTACEVMLFHHEDMGIPGEIAKFGIRQGMWAAVKKIERGLRAYQKVRASRAPLSRTAFMAQINTKVDPDYLKSLETDEDPTETEVVGPLEKPTRMNVPKLVFLGAAVALACSLDRGLLTKAVIFGVARRFANLGRRACPRT
ncbi:hypothetical protein RJ640_028314 [Escallonia rubra]|uniref:START domain-containing protein n=1 Tax=Escallonia rubra TaxID=112253 RepID=A0AA88SAW7_9ASTE|nr:hypothetical protein RJ640_028314 [Escallonia rubra]